ncbi:hypothetical protein [Pseudophaeobacter sp.]|uniref:hypothetical protein n=1 Tax=Pseudophaeobacter sp. TaxID=1971739 RepID=UPI003297A71A
MSEIFVGIWKNAPIWVWPLFFVLLAIGLFAMKTRNSSIVPYFFYPLFGLTAANSLMGLVHVPTSWIIFACFYMVGLAMAFRWQDGLILEKKDWTMRLQGDKITIIILMLIFFSNFVNGVFEAVAPQVLNTLLYTVTFGGLIGLCSGSFTGRALRVVTLGDRGAVTSV